MPDADWIVVGAGSAGCIVAARLAGQHGFRVTVVEPPARQAPPADRQRPCRWLKLLGSVEDWDLTVQPDPQLAGRTLRWPRGRGLGGSSRINAMIWFPPTERDFAMLCDAAGPRWTDTQLRAAYRSVQDLVQPQPPLWLSDASQHFLEVAGRIADARPMVYRRVNRGGRRWNPANLIAADNRIQIVRAAGDRLLWDGDRVVGVRVITDATCSDLHARRGVVLCAGAIASPALLMRSGIGPRDQLATHRIDLHTDHPGVGQNLQDHLIMPVIFRTRSPNPMAATPSVRDLARWQTLGTGPVGSNLAECGGLFNRDLIQIHVTPTHYLTYPNSVASVMTLGVNLTRPTSRGAIVLRSARHDHQPLIDAGYLSSPGDLSDTILGVRLARTIASSEGLSSFVTGEELPGSKREGDASIAKSIARYSQTLYHPVGTCRLGCDRGAVVDPTFAVTAARRLWVADASILPNVTVGNPVATVMSLAWMAAGIIAEQSCTI